MEKREFEPGIYRHFKGGMYYALGIAVDTETNCLMVEYANVHGTVPMLYTRPLSMFMNKVDKDKYPKATQEYRFEKIHITDKDTTPAMIAINCNIARLSAALNDQLNILREHIDPVYYHTTPVYTVDVYPIDDFEQYKLDSLRLSYLDKYGVDNWEGYSLAMQDFNEEFGDEGDED